MLPIRSTSREPTTGGLRHGQIVNSAKEPHPAADAAAWGFVLSLRILQSQACTNGQPSNRPSFFSQGLHRVDS